MKLLHRLVGNLLVQNANQWPTIQRKCNQTGECPNSGVVMTSNGAATFRATGCRQMTGDGGAKFRGAVYFQTSAPSLMSVNGKCMVYEWDVDGQGNATWNIWEWI